MKKLISKGIAMLLAIAIILTMDVGSVMAADGTGQDTIQITGPANNSTVTNLVIKGTATNTSTIRLTDWLDSQEYGTITPSSDGSFEKEIKLPKNGYFKIYFRQNETELGTLEVVYKGYAPEVTNLAATKIDDHNICIQGDIDKKYADNYVIKAFTINGQDYKSELTEHTADGGYKSFACNVTLPQNNVVRIDVTDEFDQTTTIRKKVGMDSDPVQLTDTMEEPGQSETFVPAFSVESPKSGDKIAKKFHITGSANIAGKISMVDFEENVKAQAEITKPGDFDVEATFTGKEGSYYNLHFVFEPQTGDKIKQENGVNLKVKLNGPVITDVKAVPVEEGKMKITGVVDANDMLFYDKPAIMINGESVSDIKSRNYDDPTEYGYSFAFETTYSDGKEIWINATDSWGNKTIQTWKAQQVDDQITLEDITEAGSSSPSVKPEVKPAAPGISLSDSEKNVDKQGFTKAEEIEITGTTAVDCKVDIYNGLTKVKTVDTKNKKFTAKVPLQEGYNRIVAKAVVEGVESAGSNDIYIHKDTQGPILSIDHKFVYEGPENDRLEETLGILQARLHIVAEDKNCEIKELWVNDVQQDISDQSYTKISYTANFPAVEGNNIYKIVAVDQMGNKTTMNYQAKAPMKATNENTTLDDPTDEIVDVPCNILQWIMVCQISENASYDARKAYDQAKTDFEEGKITQDQLDAAEQNYDTAKANVIGLKFDDMNLPTGKYITRKQIERMDKIYFEEPDHDDLYRFSNHIKSFEGLEYATNMEQLWLSYSVRLGEINGDAALEPLHSLKKLKSVKLRNDALTSIVPLENSKGIEYLEISGNKLTDISTVKNFQNLQKLYLNGNYQLEDISPLEDLENLDTLDLSNTSVTDLSPIMHLRKLTTLRLDGLPFKGREDQVLQAIAVQAKIDDGEFTEADQEVLDGLDEDIRNFVELEKPQVSPDENVEEDSSKDQDPTIAQNTGKKSEPVIEKAKDTKEDKTVDKVSDKTKDQKGSPKTGDESQISMWLMIMVVAGAVSMIMKKNLSRK